MESQFLAGINFFHPAFEQPLFRFCFCSQSNYESSSHNVVSLRFVQMLLFSMIQTIAPCAARRDDHEQRIGHADFHDLPLSVSLRSEALSYFRLSQGQTPIHTKRSSFVFFCLPRSSLFSPGLCALCASVVNTFCLPPSPRPRRR